MSDERLYAPSTCKRQLEEADAEIARLKDELRGLAYLVQHYVGEDAPPGLLYLKNIARNVLENPDNL